MTKAGDGSGRAGDDERLELMGTLLDRIPDFFYVHNAEMRFQYANRAAAEYFGHTKESIVGLRHRDVDGDADQSEFYEEMLIPIIERGDPVTTDDLPYIRSDGSAGLLQANIIPFDDPKTGERMMLGISRDVTSDRRLADELASRAAMERELSIARRVQSSLLPKDVPFLAGYDIAARCEPAEFVGGDFYDFIALPDDRWIALLGDVTGHGIGSALIAAVCRSFGRVLFPQQDLPTAMRELDTLMRADVQLGSFVTLAAIELDPAAGRLKYLSAGHGPVQVLRVDGALETLPTHTTPLALGLAEDVLESTEIALGEGDCLVVPTDGLIESHNASGEQFGVDRLLRAAAIDGVSAERMDRCFAEESAWRGDASPDDDRTMVIISRL